MLHLYLGPMYAGKTTKLIHMYDSNKDLNKVIIDFEPVEYCYEGKVKNHNNIEMNAIKTKKLYDVLSIYKCKGNLALSPDITNVYDQTLNEPEIYRLSDQISQANSIYINEAQFFPDLYDFVLDQLKQNKNLYLYGLDGDFQQKKIGSLLDLIPYCDSICKLNSICERCNQTAIFTKRIVDNMEQYLPDENAYIPLCRNCFYIV